MTLHIRDLAQTPNLPFPGAVHVPRPARPSLYETFGKQAFDVALIVLAMPFVLPIMVLIALAVSLDGRNPFYRQKRIGRHGRVFEILKFRTMVPDADQALADHLQADPAARAEWDRSQKLKSDPRITRVGRILRKSSLDELPQLFNVLTGDMSLIGPRPMMVEQIKLYPGDAYFDMRPGISGLWQVGDRNETSFAERATYDDTYHRDLSARLDLWILMRTFTVVLRGTGY